VHDPSDWPTFRAAAHRALDRAFDALERVGNGAVWTEPPADVRERFQMPMPQEPRSFADVVRDFERDVLPYPVGNQHPRIFGWVHGSAAPGGAVADALAALMNVNAGGRNHAAVYVERQVLRWFADLFAFPQSSSGVLTGGTSSATVLAVACARTHALGEAARAHGVQSLAHRLVGYAPITAHACLRKAFELTGLGGEALRAISVGDDGRASAATFADAIARDRAEGLQPFFLAGNAGSVDTGATDPLDELAETARREGLWFHVDGAFGAAAMLAPSLRAAFAGIERADSLVFDFHKWLRVPYDAGCVLIRDGDLHRRTFVAEDAYFIHEQDGLAGASPWFADLGVDLSRSFRALKVWFTLQEHGARALGASIERDVKLARLLAERIDMDPSLERTAPVPLNVVCFRPRVDAAPAELDALTDRVAARVQNGGRAVLSTTTIAGSRSLRACFTNHRTQESDLDVLLHAVRDAVTAELAQR
jgi:glutamate/tyrosine decarboxylase-like PLP-dependent enzyme